LASCRRQGLLTSVVDDVCAFGDWWPPRTCKQATGLAYEEAHVTLPCSLLSVHPSTVSRPRVQFATPQVLWRPARVLLLRKCMCQSKPLASTHTPCTHTRPLYLSLNDSRDTYTDGPVVDCVAAVANARRVGPGVPRGQRPGVLGSKLLSEDRVALRTASRMAGPPRTCVDGPAPSRSDRSVASRVSR